MFTKSIGIELKKFGIAHPYSVLLLSLCFAAIEKCCIYAAPVIDRQDGFLKSIREQMPLIGKK